jgi:hypothetical protein
MRPARPRIRLEQRSARVVATLLPDLRKSYVGIKPFALTNTAVSGSLRSFPVMWTARPSATFNGMMYCVDQPNCEGCGLQMKALGQLPPVNGRPVVDVFKCDSCRRIASREQSRLPKATLPQRDRIDRIRTTAPEPSADRDPPAAVRTVR